MKPNKRSGTRKNAHQSTQRPRRSHPARTHTTPRGQRSVQTVVEGTIKTTARGLGFLTREDTGETVRVEADFLNTALNGDRVEVSLLPHAPGDDQRGEVTKILVRNKMEFVGVIQKENGFLYLVPQDTKMYRHIIIPKEKSRNAESGDKALGRITRWTSAKHDPEGEIVRVIGKAGTNNVEMEAIVLDKGFATTFAPEIERAAQDLKTRAPELFAHEETHRRDMRSVPTFTIDPESAKDFDDALSVQELADGTIEVGVHIADVSFYVKEGDTLDKEAERRGTSIYLVDRTIPMLPEVLSNDLCSLNSLEDKLAFSAVFTFTKDALKKGAQVKANTHWFGRTIIRSDKRFSYETAQKVLDDGQGEYHAELVQLNTIGKNLRNKREAEGAINFESEEVRFTLDADGKPTGVYVKEMLDTNHLIEEFMLLANRSVAEYIGRQKKHFVYRIHDKPDADRIKELTTFLHGLGYDVKLAKDRDGRVSSRDINTMLDTMEGKAEEHLVQTATIRSMAKAIYSTKNIGHYGLGFEYYTHFTSPIRRYPDMMVHRLLAIYLAGKTPTAAQLRAHQRIVLYASQMEQNAQSAERDSIKYKQAEYMQSRVGQTFSGVISGVTDWGIFVEENETKAEGLIRMRDLGDDYYIYDKEGFRIVGEKTKKEFRLGDTVKVRVTGVDMERKLVEYSLVK